MKVTRKPQSFSKVLRIPDDLDKDGDGEIAPSLYVHDLPKEIDGLPDPGEHFEAHVKGKVRRHSHTQEGGKDRHSYDLDIHHIEPKGNGPAKKKKSTREEVEEAFKKHGPKDED